MQVKEYHRPATREEAMALLRRKTPRTVVLAGGTWINGECPDGIEAVVDISALGLDRVDRQDSPPLLRIGAMVTLQTLSESLRRIPGLDVISVTAHAMAALNIRHRATLGGAIVTADAASPLVTALLACDADLVVVTGEEHVLSLPAFLSYREPLLADGMLILGVQMPIPSADTITAYERVARTPSDYPIVCAVARCAVKDGIAGNLRIALGGVAPTPIRLSTLEFALEKKPVREQLGNALDDAIARLSPQGNWLGSAEYRAEMARVLSRRAILNAAGTSE